MHREFLIDAAPRHAAPRIISHQLKLIPTLPAFLKVEISRKCTVHCKYCYFPKADVFFPFERLLVAPVHDGRWLHLFRRASGSHRFQGLTSRAR